MFVRESLEGENVLLHILYAISLNYVPVSVQAKDSCRILRYPASQWLYRLSPHGMVPSSLALDT